MGIFDRFRSRSRVNDIDEARRLAEEENEARDRRRAEREARNSRRAEESGTPASANQDRFIVNVANKFVPKSQGGWVFLVILIVFIAGMFTLGHYGYLNFALPYLAYVLPYVIYGTIAFFIVYGIITGIRDGNKEKVFITIALVIWVIDLTSYVHIPLFGAISLGPPYAGFEFDLSGSLNTDWMAVISSFTVFIFLYFNMIKNIIKHEYVSFGLSFFFILIVNNYVTGFLKFLGIVEFTVPFLIPYGKYVYFAMSFLALALIFVFREKLGAGEIPNLFSYLFMAFVLSFFWINNGWLGNLKAIIHAAFILIFGFMYIAKREQDNPVVWHIMVPSLLIIDFYGYGFFLNSNYDVLKFIPIFLIVVIFYCYYETESNFALVAFMILATVFVIFSFRAYGYDTTTVQYQARQGGPDYHEFLNVFFTRLGMVGSGIQRGIDNRLNFATGGYFSQVENNQYEPLGVFFDKVRASQPKFYTDDDVTLWSTIKSRTLSDPTIVNFTCFRWKDNSLKANTRIEAKKEGQTKNDNEIYDEVIPEKQFTVYTLEETDSECTFKQDLEHNKLKAGTNIITLSATYNFATNAYQKIYLIDKSRYRSMIRENLDPLKEFGITDRTPVAIYTNGPLEIAVNNQDIITVGDSGLPPILGIMIKNRGKITDKKGQPIGQWEGKIRKIKELVVVLPKGITLEELEDGVANCKPFPFNAYDLKDCKDACVEYVHSPCEDACDSADAECIPNCDAGKEKCERECDDLFKSDTDTGEEDYTGYKIDTEKLYEKTKDEYKDIESGRNTVFGCKLKLDKTRVLENSPITTKYIRIRARYDYLVEKTVNVIVEQTPGTIGSDISALINKYAKENEVDIDLIKAIAIVESGAQHCKTGGNNCAKEQVKINGKALGIMQINIDIEPGSKWKDDASSICGAGKTAYDADCNVLLGITTLKEKYNQFKNGIPDNLLQKNCPSSSQYYNRYSAYRGWEAAIRGYNGISCGEGSDTEYVEKVGNKYKLIKDRIIGEDIKQKLSQIDAFNQQSQNPIS